MIGELTYKTPVHASHEAQLIDAAKKDPAAFEPLYRVYFPGIFRFILNRVGDREITADLTSQVFLKALDHISGFEFRGISLSSWLYRIAVNTTAEYFRKVKKVRYVILDENALVRLCGSFNGEEESSSPDPERIKEIFETLSPGEVQLIEMRFFEQMSFRAIGEILDITENNAKVRLYRILAKVKNRLKP